MGLSRSGATGVSGTHFEGPLLASKGPLEDAPLGIIDRARSPYKVWYEDFSEQSADAQIETMGFTVTAINTPTAATEVILGADRGLFINPGSKADSGSELQFNIPSTAASLGSTFKIIPEIVSTATLMDNQEIFFQVRMATRSDSATDNDCKWILGWFTNDTTLMNSGTGVPSVAAGGGFGFVKAEAGGVTAVSTSDAITAAGTALSPARTEVALGATATDVWHTYAARMRVIDASAKTGVTDFWYDGKHALTLGTVSMDSTETYAFTVGVHNGPAQIADLTIDYILTGITRPGLTWPYTDGTIY